MNRARSKSNRLEMVETSPPVVERHDRHSNETTAPSSEEGDVAAEKPASHLPGANKKEKKTVTLSALEPHPIDSNGKPNSKAETASLSTNNGADSVSVRSESPDTSPRFKYVVLVASFM